MKLIIIVGLLLGMALSAQAAGQSKSSSAKSGKAPLSREALEKIEIADEGIDAIDAMRKSLDKLGRQRRSACQKALGSEKFCECLANSLPIAIDFMAYIKILTSTKEELGYDKASEGDKKLVDLTLAARETCVLGGY